MSDRIVSRATVALGLLTALFVPEAHAADASDVSSLLTVIACTALGVVVIGAAVMRWAPYFRDAVRIRCVVRRYSRSVA